VKISILNDAASSKVRFAPVMLCLGCAIRKLGRQVDKKRPFRGCPPNNVLYMFFTVREDFVLT